MKYLIKSLILLLFASFSLFAQDGLTLSFHSGFPISGTSVGLKMGKILPYGGVDLVWFSASYDESYVSHSTGYNSDYNRNEYYKDYERNSKMEGSGMLIIPRVGLKLFLSENKIKTYLKGEFMLIIPSFDGKDSGRRTDYNLNGTIDYIDEWNDEISQKDIDLLEDAVGIWGVAVGFGAEYEIGENFTIGGEFGIRALLDSFDATDSYDSYDDDPYSDYRYSDEWSDKLDATLGLTYTSFSLNYYFN